MGKGRREEGEGDAEAVAVEELHGVIGEAGGGGDVVSLEGNGRGWHGGVAETGSGVGREGGGIGDEVAGDVGEEGVCKGALGATTGDGGEEVDGEGAVGGGEEAADGLVRAGGVGGGDG